MDALNEAALRRNLYSIGSTVSRRVAAAAATAVRNQNNVIYVLCLDIPVNVGLGLLVCMLFSPTRRFFLAV